MKQTALLIFPLALLAACTPSPLTFRGQQSRNLLIKQTLISTDLSSSASQTTVFTYSYNFDQQNRPIREFVVADTEATPRSVREFVYQ